MATYKVLQDIEAEDHILGPLSLRQFIYALVAALCFYLCYIVSSKGASFLIALFLPPGLFCAFFAAPFGKDQPTEVWALAKIRFFFKPRRRIWDQSGMKELVTVTAPKRVEIHRTDGLSQSEVKSRLAALASTIDSRGWAVKNVDLNLYTQPGVFVSNTDSDRLISPDTIPQQVPSYDINAADDILDAQSNPIAQQFDQMINASSQAHRQQLVSMLQHDSPQGAVLPAPITTDSDQPNGQGWFMQQTSPSVPVNPTLTGGSDAGLDEAEITRQLKLKASEPSMSVAFSHMKVIQPLGHTGPTPVTPPAPAVPDEASAPAVAAPTPTPVPPQGTQLPAVDNTHLAARDDLNISTIARVAGKKDLPPDDEVIITLH
jgi:hypothetical protein